MEIDKIKEMLEYRFSLTTELPQKRHIIFWYDSKKEFKDLIDNLNLTDVKIIKLTKSLDKKGESIYTNIFKTKYTLEVIDTESNYLIYSEYPRAIDSENYLLDIEKYSEFFEADKSAMIVEELKLDRTNYRFGEIIREYSSFFANKERREKLIKLIENPESLDEEEFKRALLFLRRAFADFTSNEKHDIAENIAEIWGLNKYEVSAVVNKDLEKDEKEIVSKLEEFDFDDI